MKRYQTIVNRIKFLMIRLALLTTASVIFSVSSALAKTPKPEDIQLELLVPVETQADITKLEFPDLPYANVSFRWRYTSVANLGDIRSIFQNLENLEKKIKRVGFSLMRVENYGSWSSADGYDNKTFKPIYVGECGEKLVGITKPSELNKVFEGSKPFISSIDCGKELEPNSWYKWSIRAYYTDDVTDWVGKTGWFRTGSNRYKEITTYSGNTRSTIETEVDIIEPSGSLFNEEHVKWLTQGVQFKGKDYSIKKIFHKAGLDVNLNIDDIIPENLPCFKQHELVELAKNKYRNHWSQQHLYYVIATALCNADGTHDDTWGIMIPKPPRSIYNFTFADAIAGYLNDARNRTPPALSGIVDFDLEDILIGVTAHEIGHALGLKHEDSDAFDADLPCISNGRCVMPTQIRKHAHTIMKTGEIAIDDGGPVDDFELEWNTGSLRHFYQHPTQNWQAFGKRQLLMCHQYISPPTTRSSKADKLQSLSDLKTEIIANKTDYLLGEPVVLYVSLQNTSNSPIEVFPYLDPSRQTTQYFIKRPSETHTEEYFPAIILDGDFPRKELAPNETIREEVKLFVSAGSWTFNEPGSYEITAQTMNPSTVSNTITINIHAPTDESSIKAAELLLSEDPETGSDIPFLLLWEEGEFEEAIQVLEQIASQYPDTVYATYANQVLGNRLTQDTFSFKIGATRPSDPSTAISFLEKARQKPLSFYDTLHTHLSLYNAYQQINETQAADAIIKELNEITATQFADFYPFFTDTLQKLNIPILDNLTLTINKQGNGTVTDDQEKIDCGATCSADYPPNTTVTLTATPATGSSFTGWQGACSGTELTTEVTLDNSKACTAVFFNPLAVTLSNSTLTPLANGFRLSWQTSYEDNCAGFQVWRAWVADGPCWDKEVDEYQDITQLTEQLLIAEGEGSSYTFDDLSINPIAPWLAASGGADTAAEGKPGYCYGLEEVHFDGSSSFYIFDPNVEEWVPLTD